MTNSTQDERIHTSIHPDNELGRNPCKLYLLQPNLQGNFSFETYSNYPRRC